MVAAASKVVAFVQDVFAQGAKIIAKLILNMETMYISAMSVRNYDDRENYLEYNGKHKQESSVARK